MEPEEPGSEILQDVIGFENAVLGSIDVNTFAEGSNRNTHGWTFSGSNAPPRRVT